MAENAAAPARLLYLDAFRGFTMICMIGGGFGLPHLRNSPALGSLARQFQHAAWEGLTAWDLVMPFFLCVVGAVMPVSFARRWASGETWRQSFGHVVRRSALLIGWGVFERSVQTGAPTFDILSVLTHIAVAYLIAFLLLDATWKTQAVAALAILAPHWALYQFAQADGIAGPFARDSNAGSYVDRTIFGRVWPGSYTCLNVIGETVNVLSGVLAGRLMMSALPAARKMLLLATSGAGTIAAGLILAQWIPVIKRLWTASYTLCSIGITLLALLLFYWLAEVQQWRRWTVPVRGVGGLILQAWAVLAFEVCVCYWLYRRKIFFKI